MTKFAQLDLAPVTVTVGNVSATRSLVGRPMSDDTLWPLEPATEAKHRLYKRYLDGWWPKMLQPLPPNGWRRSRVTYVDAFAGPGRYASGEEGSPLFVLQRLLNHAAVERMKLSRERVHLVFIEKRRDRFDHLRGELTAKFGDLDRLPVHVELRHGDAAEETEKALDDLNGWGNAVLAIFDSWGNVRVPLPLVQRLASNKSSEVIVTFGPNWFSRREDLNPDQLDLVFGGREHWEPATAKSGPAERWRSWLGAYRNALQRAGFEYRLQFEVVPRTGLPLYLVYGTTHPEGVKVMKDAMWNVDGLDGMGFRDPRTTGAQAFGQLGLFSGANGTDPELIELITQRLTGGPVTVEDLRDWLLRETARWREQHAIPALREMVTAGNIVSEPPGKITKTSVVRLP